MFSHLQKDIVGLRPQRTSERLPPSFGPLRGPAAGSPRSRPLRLHIRYSP